MTLLREGEAPSLDWILSMNLRPELVAAVRSAVSELKGIAGGEFWRDTSAVVGVYAASVFRVLVIYL